MNAIDTVKEGAHSALIMAVGRLLMQVLALLAAVILPWVMSTADYGRFTSIMALVSLGGMLAELGLSWLEMRLLAPAWRRGDKQTALQIASTTFLLRLSLEIVVSAVLCFWLWLSPELGLSFTHILIIGIWMLARMGGGFVASMQLPLGKRSLSMKLDISRSVIHLLGAAIGYLWTGLPGAFALLAISHFPLFLISIGLLYKTLPVSWKLVSFGLIRKNQSYLVWTAITAVMAGFQLWLPVFLVGAYGSLLEVAVLGISIQALGVMHSVGTGIRQGLMPIISEQNANNEVQQSVFWSSLLIRLVSTATTVGIIVWLFIGSEVLLVVFPPDYAGLYLDLGLAMLVFIALSVGAASDVLLNIRGHAKASAINLVFFAVVTILGTLWAVHTVPNDSASLVMVVYLIAASFFALKTRKSLLRLDGVHIPILPSFLLTIPGLLLLLFVWLSEVEIKIWWVIVFLPLYLIYVFITKLLCLSEVKRVIAAIRS